MQFFHPEWFNLIWVLMFLIGLLIWAGQRKKKLIQAFGDLELIKRLSSNHSAAKETIKKILYVIALGILIFALAQPQWGETKQQIQRKGIDIIAVVDTSLSMLAEDIPPNRIEKAKLEMKSFLRELKGDRIGVVTFAGTGFIQSPLTIDYDAFLLFANSIQVGYIPDPGTSLSEAINTAVKALGNNKKAKNRVILLLSDGEHHEGDVEQAIKTATEANVRIYTVGIGSKEGAPIPLRADKGKVSGYKKDRAGEIVITKLNDELLTRIAKSTGGAYFPATPGEKEVEWIYQHMQNLEKQDFKQRVITERENHFQIFLLIGLFVLIAELLVTEVKKEKKSYA